MSARQRRVWPDFVAGGYLIVVQPFRAAAARKGCTTMAIAATKSGHTLSDTSDKECALQARRVYDHEEGDGHDESTLRHLPYVYDD